MTNLAMENDENGPFIDGKHLLRIVIFHGELSNNQMVVGYELFFLPPVSSNMARSEVHNQKLADGNPMFDYQRVRI